MDFRTLDNEIMKSVTPKVVDCCGFVVQQIHNNAQQIETNNII